MKKNVKWTYHETSGEHSGKGTIFGVCPYGFGLRWDISGHWYRGFAQNFDTNHMGRVVCPGEPLKTYSESRNTHFLEMSILSRDSRNVDFPITTENAGASSHKGSFSDSIGWLWKSWSPPKRKKLTRPTIRRSGRNAFMRTGEVVIKLMLSLFAYHKPKDKGTIGCAVIL